MTELEKFENLLESFAKRDIEEYCDLAANLYNKVLNGVVFTTLDEESQIMVLRRKGAPKGNLITPQVKVKLLKKRESVSRKYGRAVASAVIDPILKSNNTDEIDDIDDRVDNIIAMNGIDPGSGRKLPIKKGENKKMKKSLKESENTLTELLNAIRNDIQDEYEAVINYDKHADELEELGYEDAAKVLRDIRDEEKVHIGELQKLLEKYDSDFDKSMEEGAEEVKEELKEAATFDEKEAKEKKLESEIQDLQDREDDAERYEPDHPYADNENSKSSKINAEKHEKIDELKKVKEEKIDGKVTSSGQVSWFEEKKK